MNEQKDPDGFAQAAPPARDPVDVGPGWPSHADDPHPVTDGMEEDGSDGEQEPAHGFFFSQTEDGGMIPAWHATWRYQMGDGVADNAVIGLHWIMRAIWFTWVWIKAGARNVPIDPHEAFFQGQQLGYREALDTLPEDIRLKAIVADGRMAQASEMIRHFGIWQAVEMQWRQVEEAYKAQDLGALRTAMGMMIHLHAQAKESNMAVTIPSQS